MNANLIASLIFGFFGLYFSIMNILNNLYGRACDKIQESCKFKINDCIYIPTEEQAKLLQVDINRAEADSNMARVYGKDRLYYIKINITRYNLIVKALKILTFGKFKHVV